LHFGEGSFFFLVEEVNGVFTEHFTVFGGGLADLGQVEEYVRACDGFGEGWLGFWSFMGAHVFENRDYFGGDLGEHEFLKHGHLGFFDGHFPERLGFYVEVQRGVFEKFRSVCFEELCFDEVGFDAPVLDFEP
jgi:hypothetical protein